MGDMKIRVPEVYVPEEMHPLDEWARLFLTLTKVREVRVTLPAVGGGYVTVGFQR